MLSSSVWILFLLSGGFQCVFGTQPEENTAGSESQVSASQPEESSTDTGPLFLTPYIDNCTYYEARNKSKVPYFQKIGVTAHSGYITVNKTTQSNLFFLLTEVEGNSSSAPLLLWTQGGPGLSALFGLFLENGPFVFDIYTNGSPNIYPREKTLQKNMSVLYVDLPVGAGFSFTNETHGYPTKLEDIVGHVQEFLTQFLKVFSEYENREIYLAGESYGARYSVAIAYYWNLTGMQNLKLNLKGVIGGNGFLGPVLDVADSTEFLYSMSMLNASGRTRFGGQFEMMRQLQASQNTTLKMYALKLLFETIFTNDETPTLFQNLTLYNDHASPMFTRRPLQMLYCFGFLNDSTTKVALHAGMNTNFQINNPFLLLSFATDWLRDISAFNERVLNESRVLFYTGQMDALFPSVNQRNYFRSLNWTYADDYRNATRCPWKPHDYYYGFAGYIKTAHEFTEAVILGMSHYGAAEKPDEAYYLITEFIANSTKGPTAPAPASNGVMEGTSK
ncbi:probable serine carboxypeptidase CPVL [Dermacentor silvarum]|uniref:probable serine carboxypeptidase CPVL n=1 Tax=Dermacentor silvarum TaxID=543639 RepID=UPI0021016356|nr:probable serine carboxypeptidase CPVL [Dermacentor silvarum]